jgi:hypothetical protein
MESMKTSLEHLTAAFRLAHRASEDEKFDQAARNIFRAVAHEIWMAHGKTAADVDRLEYAKALAAKREAN